MSPSLHFQSANSLSSLIILSPLSFVLDSDLASLKGFDLIIELSLTGRRLSKKMRWYILASWILLILSIIDFTRAVPIAGLDIHGVRIDMADVAEDNKMAALQKRMDPDEHQVSDLTSEHGSPEPAPAPAPEPNSESGSNPDSDSDSYNSDGGGAAAHWEEEFQNYNPSDIEEGLGSNSGSDSESSSDSDNSGGGEGAAHWEEEFQNYNPSDMEEGDMSDQEEHQDSSDNEGDDHRQSPPGSPAPEVPHPAASTYEGLWREVFEGFLRPRTSPYGAMVRQRRSSNLLGNR